MKELFKEQAPPQVNSSH